MKIKLIATSFILGITLAISGCSAHTTLSKPLDNTTSVAFGSCSFLVPSDCYEEATDFVPMLSTHYATLEEKDIAKATLSSGAIKGLTDTGFLLTSPSYFFYTAKASGTVNLLTCSRDDILSLVNRKDISFENYGRYIANADTQGKANMRVDFRVTSSNGTSRAYAGYVGITECSDGLYYYIAGYTHSTSTEAQLKNCFDLVRSLQ